MPITLQDRKTSRAASRARGENVVSMCRNLEWRLMTADSAVARRAYVRSCPNHAARCIPKAGTSSQAQAQAQAQQSQVPHAH